MATGQQSRAAKQNIRKAQAAWKSMTPRQRALAQPEGGARRTPGSRGSGDYYHVAVRPKGGFVTFRTQDVGQPGHIQRVAGKRGSGSWDTVKWLIGKRDAHVAHEKLVADTTGARKVLDALGSVPMHTTGDRFTARPRRNVPESEKPTVAQRRARSRNIRKAQAARRRMKS